MLTQQRAQLISVLMGVKKGISSRLSVVRFLCHGLVLHRVWKVGSGRWKARVWLVHSSLLLLLLLLSLGGTPVAISPPLLGLGRFLRFFFEYVEKLVRKERHCRIPHVLVYKDLRKRPHSSVDMPLKTRASAAAENGPPAGRVQEPALQSTPELSKRRKKPHSAGNTGSSSSLKTLLLSGLKKKSPLECSTERVAGARMSSFKHSGLLERDERPLGGAPEGEEVESGVPLLLTAQLALEGGRGEEGGGEGGEEELQQVSGRDIYSIQGLHRSAKKPTRKTPTTSKTRPQENDGKVKRSIPQEPGEEGVSVESEDAVQVGAEARKKMTNSGPVVRSKQQRDNGESVEKEDVMAEVQPGRSRGSGVSSAVNSRRAGGKRKERVLQLSSDSEHKLSDEEEDGEEEGEGEEDEMASIATQLNKGSATESALEDYFTAHTGRHGVTSDHTLSRLARPRLEQGVVQTALQTRPSPFQSDCQRLYEEHSLLYPYWLVEMHSGFNVLLYGLGSKKRLMEDFCKQCLPDSVYLVVNGYFPGLTVKQVLTSLSSDLLGHNGSFKSHTEHAQFVADVLERQSSKKGGVSNIAIPPHEVFLVIHNLDGPMLRNDQAQAALSILAVSKRVHVIASVDHINAPLLCDQARLSRFNWTWHDVTTFQTYREETSYENSLLVRQSGSLALSSLNHVVRSLTPNARGIFELLARYQLEHKKDGCSEKGYQGLSFSECYRRCREKFLVNSDLTLRAQLTEFIDHKLVRSNKGSDGVEYLLIPVDDATLSQFLSEFID